MNQILREYVMKRFKQSEIILVVHELNHFHWDPRLTQFTLLTSLVL